MSDQAMTGQVTVDTTTYPFPVFTVTGAGFDANEELQLDVTSFPTSGTGGGATLNYPHVHADANGAFTYGPQYAGVLFPDKVERTITAKFWHVGLVAQTKAKTA